MIPFTIPAEWPSAAELAGRFASRVQHGERMSGSTGISNSICLLGAPDDTGVQLNRGRVGACEGPRAFRAALARYGTESPAAPDGVTPAFPPVLDAGDVQPGADIHETHDRVSAAVAAMVERGALPVMIGGGHDLTFAAARAIAGGVGELHLVYLDAHLDVRPTDGSGMPMRSLVEAGSVRALSVVGLDMLVNSSEHCDWYVAHGGECVAPEDAAAVARLLPASGGGGTPIYVSLDLDALDAAFAPGVSAINPCGMSPAQAGVWAEAAGRCPLVKGFDIMELNPRHDEGGRTARLAAHLFLRFMRGFTQRAPSVGRVA